MRGRKEIMRGMGGGTEGQATPTTNTSTASSAPMPRFVGPLPAPTTAARGRSEEREETLPPRFVSPVDTSLRPKSEAVPYGPPPPPRGVVPKPASKKRRERAPSTSSSSSESSDASAPIYGKLYAPNIRDNHLITTRHKKGNKGRFLEKALDAAEGRLEKLNSPSLRTQTGAVRKMTYIHDNPKFQERLHDRLYEKGFQRRLKNASAGDDAWTDPVKGRAVTFNVEGSHPNYRINHQATYIPHGELEMKVGSKDFGAGVPATTSRSGRTLRKINHFAGIRATGERPGKKALKSLDVMQYLADKGII